jgi:hypothetical protein
VGKCEALSDAIGITDVLKGYKGSEDPDAREDGGRGFLSKEELHAREMSFMEMYLSKRTVVEKALEENKRKGWKERIFSK